MALLKCKHGDLALVLYDTPGCEQNIGKVVIVRGPARIVIKTQMMGWRIKPLFPAPWGVVLHNGAIKSVVVDWFSCVFHEDAWLMPLRPLPPDAVWQEIQREMDRYLLDIGAVVSS
jgi:hypothetical protein